MPATFHAVDPRTGRPGPDVEATSPDAVEALLVGAEQAAGDGSLADARRRAAMLRAAARRLGDAADAIVATAAGETGLGEPRLVGELARTRMQLELFAAVILAGDHLDAMIDTADPDAAPAPRPDLRRMLVPLGPVVVFGASNFPLAFSTAGGDTASALAAGCPVIVKAHPAHPRTSTVVAGLLDAAVADAGLPRGTFGHALGAGASLGERLVDDPRVQAVGFTGSEAGGRALAARAAARPRPIPVFAEMGSLNPFVVTASALAARGPAIAEGLARSVATSGGQLCTKPGLVFVPAGPQGLAFSDALVERLAAHPHEVLLTEAIARRLRSGIADVERVDGVERLTPRRDRPGQGLWAAPVVLQTGVERLRAEPALQQELFGPAVLVVVYDGDDALLAGLDGLAGQLTATVHSEVEDRAALAPILALCVRRAGRVVFDGYPTGLSPCWALQHGGPFPASTDAAATSVGANATRRFMRPVAFQDAPDALLPAALKRANPLSVWRRVDGVPTPPDLAVG